MCEQRSFSRPGISRNSFLNSHPRSKQHITSFLDFLQACHSFLKPVLLCFHSLADGFVSIGHSKTPMPKAHELLIDLVRLCTVPVNAHISEPSQINFPPITGMNNVVTRPTYVRRPLNSLNRLTIPHTLAPSRDNTYRIWFQKNGTEHLLLKGRYYDSLRKGVHLDQFQIQIPKSTACLPQYIYVFQAGKPTVPPYC